MEKSIKNPHLIHLLRWTTYWGINPKGKKVRIKHLHYLCNGSTSITPSKSTKDIWKVTCENCRRKLLKQNTIKKKV